MASFFEPKVVGYLSDAALSEGVFVKYGSDKEHVALCGANERAIGVVHTEGGVDAAEEPVEIARLGGGGRVKVSEAVGGGKFITSGADGRGEIADAAGEYCAAIALEEATAANDLIACFLAPVVVAASDV